MRFHPTEEQLAIQDALSGTLIDTLAPKLRALIDEGYEIDRESWDAVMALGLGGIALPEAFGGSGLGLVDAAMSVEALAKEAATGPVIPHLMAGIALLHTKDEALKAEWLPKLAAGEVMATLALSGDWLPETWTITPSDGTVSGTAPFVQSALAADLFLVGLSGGTLALVQKGDGVTIEEVSTSDRSRKLFKVTFDKAPATALETNVDKVFDAGLILTAADALGGAQKVTDMSVEYAKVREQFNQPIGKFQALKHQLATMALEVEPARSLLWYAAYAFDADLADARQVAATTKAHLCDRFISTARAAVAAHGGIGYTWEYDLSIWVKRSFYDRAFLGSPATHRARAATLAGW